MVRTQQKPASEDKKETTTKKKATQKKKSPETGVWPCKINGCNKQFAREADLKRHQRTTKLHSMPGFACPQCDATFTRTDALRRHQKSRHNGVIIEPAEHDKAKPGIDDEAGSSGSKSKSRSATPSKGQGQPATVGAHPGAAGPAGGPSSYYRPHTMENTFVPPPGMMDAQYRQGLGLPTSATRLNEASWPPPPWGDGAPGQLGPISYHMPPGRPQAHYYRTDHHDSLPNLMYPALTPVPANGIPAHPMYLGAPIPNPDTSRTGTPNAQGSAVDPRLSHTDSNGNEQHGDVDMQGAMVSESAGASAAPVIDPSLDASSNSPSSNAPKDGADSGGAGSSKTLSLEITQAAMEAVLESAKRESSLAGGATSSSGTPEVPHTEADGMQEADGSQAEGISRQRGSAGASGAGEGDEVDADGDADDENVLGREHSSAETMGNNGHEHIHGYDDSGRPPPMEHMLTEDGEPMLNPAELLTQESLASPPPS